MNRFLPVLVLLLLLPAVSAQADIWYHDQDGDGWGNPYDWLDWPTQPAGYVSVAGDCDDNDYAIHPEANEYPADGVDSDCDGHELCYEDQDDDGWGTDYLVEAFSLGCDGPGEAHQTGDCDDTDPGANPGASEVPGNDADEDCNGSVDCFVDFDLDTYGSNDVAVDASPSGIPSACNSYGFADDNDDCNDGESTINPGQAEIWYDGIDADCDSWNDFDQDRDTYVAEDYEAEAGGTSPNGGDCDDTESAVNPGATEICGDGIDNDCSGEADDGCLDLAITAITDVGNDQGRQVRIQWCRAYDDQPGVGETITGYDIYRRIDAYKAADPADPFDPEKQWPAGDWDFLLQVPASGEDTYHAVVPTLCDSTAAGVCWSVFFLRARTASPYVFQDCAPDSGYSIDNLAPAAPANLQAAYTADQVALQWEESGDDDFAGFRIYRSTAPDFVPSPELLVHSTTGTDWTDPTADAWDLHYIVTAVDFAGNESAPGMVQVASGVDLPGLSGRLALHPNVPNPFNPTTTLVYELADRRHVRLEIYAIDGRRVKVLEDGWRTAGLHRVPWNGRASDGRAVASGTYVCRLAAGDEVLTRQILLVK